MFWTFTALSCGSTASVIIVNILRLRYAVFGLGVCFKMAVLIGFIGLLGLKLILMQLIGCFIQVWWNLYFL